MAIPKVVFGSASRLRPPSGPWWLLLSFLLFTQALGQEVIRERIEITPRVPVTSSMNVLSSSNEPLLMDGTTSWGIPYVAPTRRGVLISASAAVSLDRLPKGTGLEVLVEDVTMLRQLNLCSGETVNQINAFVPRVVASCVPIGVGMRLLKRSTATYYCASVWGSSGSSVSVSGNSATVTLTGELVDFEVWPRQTIPVTATVTLEASMDPGYFISTVTVTPAAEELQCVGSIPVDVTVSTSSGVLPATCTSSVLQGFATLQARGPYALLQGGDQQGTSLNFPITAGRGSFVLVLDTSRGLIPQGSDVGKIQVSVAPAVGEASVQLRCDYPPPSVRITNPPRDTSFVLTEDDCPVIELMEEHSPGSGTFEPQVEWEPSGSIATADYFNEIEDSLVLTVTVTARNCVGMEAKDSRKIVLKKGKELDHFHVAAEKDTIAFSESARLFVTGMSDDDAPVTVPKGTMVDIWLMQDEPYANVFYKGQGGKSVLNIPCDEAAGGSVVIAATEQNPLAMEAQEVVVGASKAGDLSVQGSGRVYVRGTIEKFCQNDPKWGNVRYDDYVRRTQDGKSDSLDAHGNPVYFGLKDKGCALTCLAMVARAGGANVDPGSLASLLRELGNKGFQKKSVVWNSVSSLKENRHYRDVVCIGRGLVYDANDRVDLAKSTALDISRFGYFLQRGCLIVAQVYNPSTGHNHWVLVLASEAGQYKILDPGCYSDRSQLSAYGSNVYKYVVFSPTEQ